MLELYHNAHSTCSQKVRVALAEKGLAWRSRHLDLRAFEQLAPAFLEINPAGMVPVLVHDGQAIRESLAINEYLDDVFPAPPLRPASALGRARMREWTVYVAGEPTWAIKSPSYEKSIRPRLAGRYDAAGIEAITARMPDRENARRWAGAMGEGIPAAQVRADLERMARVLDRMQAALTARSWLAGDSYTLADIDMVPFVHRLEAIGEAAMVAARPRVAEWLAAMRARPAVIEAFAFAPPG